MLDAGVAGAQVVLRKVRLVALRRVDHHEEPVPGDAGQLEGAVRVCDSTGQTAALLVHRTVVEFLERDSIRYVDSATFIVEHYSENDNFESLSVPDGHRNNKGDYLVAAALSDGLARMGLIKTSAKP